MQICIKIAYRVICISIAKIDKKKLPKVTFSWDDFISPMYIHSNAIQVWIIVKSPNLASIKGMESKGIFA